MRQIYCTLGSRGHSLNVRRHSQRPLPREAVHWRTLVSGLAVVTPPADGDLRPLFEAVAGDNGTIELDELESFLCAIYRMHFLLERDYGADGDGSGRSFGDASDGHQWREDAFVRDACSVAYAQLSAYLGTKEGKAMLKKEAKRMKARVRAGNSRLVSSPHFSPHDAEIRTRRWHDPALQTVLLRLTVPSNFAHTHSFRPGRAQETRGLPSHHR